MAGLICTSWWSTSSELDFVQTSGTSSGMSGGVGEGYYETSERQWRDPCHTSR